MSDKGVMREYQVRHPEHGQVFVEAKDKYTAIVAAARRWERRWTHIARACEVLEIRQL